MYKRHCKVWFHHSNAIAVSTDGPYTLLARSTTAHRIRHETLARKTLRSRTLAADSSHAAREELLDDVRNSPGLPRIETHDACE